MSPGWSVLYLLTFGVPLVALLLRSRSRTLARRGEHERSRRLALLAFQIRVAWIGLLVLGLLGLVFVVVIAR